jgi:hypothetical protein
MSNHDALVIGGPLDCGSLLPLYRWTMAHASLLAFRFRAANRRILGRPQPGNEFGRSKLRPLWPKAGVLSPLARGTTGGVVRTNEDPLPQKTRRPPWKRGTNVETGRSKLRSRKVAQCKAEASYRTPNFPWYLTLCGRWAMD